MLNLVIITNFSEVYELFSLSLAEQVKFLV